MMFSTKFKFLANLFALLAILTTSSLVVAQDSTSTNNPDCPKKYGKYRYSMESARAGLNGIFLHNFAGTSEHLRLQFVKEQSYYDLNAGGHLVIKGRLVPAEGHEHLMLGYESFKYIMRLKFVKDDGSYVPYTEYLHVSPEVLATWKYFSIQEGSKIIGKKDGVKQEFEISAMKKEDGSEYYLQVGNQGALIGEGAQKGVYGAATWFDYKRFDGLTYKGDINVILDLVCPNLKPIEFEGVCSEKFGRYKWRLTNPNHSGALFTYTNAKGETKYVGVRGARNGAPGVREFYTSMKGDDKITLEYAVYNSEGSPAPIMATAKVTGCDPICDDKVITYAAKSFKDTGHSIWLSKFVTGKNEKLHFIRGAQLTSKKNCREAYLTGEIANDLLGMSGWTAKFIFTKAADGVEPKFELGNRTNDDGQNQRELEEDWKYMDFVSGTIRNGDKIIEIHRMDNNYGFQIGESANGKNFELGASTWFVWKYEGQSAQGDININLKALCKEKEVCKEVRIVRCRPYCGGFLLSLKSDVKYDSYKYVVVDPRTGKVISQGYKSFCNGYGFAWFPRRGVRQGQNLILKLYSKRKGYEYCHVQFVFNND